jgi:hydroxyacylglutathione hydrolase
MDRSQHKLTSMAAVLHVPAFDDNYIWLLQGASDTVAIVDPGDADAVVSALDARDLTPAAVLCTHHHWDHTGGNLALQERFDLPIYGPASERIPGMTHPLHDGARVALPGFDLNLEVIAVPGHTAGHIAYYGEQMLFCGDTLFSAGCGRLFEGTAAQMHASLSRLAALPDATRVYCAHEYTESNLRFALAVEPDNGDLLSRVGEVRALRGRGEPSLPSALATEKLTNPFLRCAEATVRDAVRNHAGREPESEVEIFAELRRWKDGFRG